MTRVAGDIQSSSRWNSGSRWLVLKPLKLTNHVQRTNFITSSTDRYYSLDSEDDFRSGCQNVILYSCLVKYKLEFPGGQAVL